MAMSWWTLLGVALPTQAAQIPPGVFEINLDPVWGSYAPLYLTQSDCPTITLVGARLTEKDPPMIIIHCDGTLTIDGPWDQAARAFWEAVEEIRPKYRRLERLDRD